MNNTIMLKGADFSGAKVGKLNIIKPSVTKDANGCVQASGGSVIAYAPSGWNWEDEIAHTSQIAFDHTISAIYGKFHIIIKTTNWETYLANPSASRLAGVMPIFCYYSERDSAWGQTTEIVYPSLEKRPRILGYKEGIYLNSNYTAVLFDGDIYVPLPSTLRVSKLIFNYIRPDAKQAPELGITVPEIYVD